MPGHPQIFIVVNGGLVENWVRPILHMPVALSPSGGVKLNLMPGRNCLLRVVAAC